MLKSSERRRTSSSTQGRALYRVLSASAKNKPPWNKFHDGFCVSIAASLQREPPHQLTYPSSGQQQACPFRRVVAWCSWRRSSAVPSEESPKLISPGSQAGDHRLRNEKCCTVGGTIWRSPRGVKVDLIGADFQLKRGAYRKTLRFLRPRVTARDPSHLAMKSQKPGHFGRFSQVRVVAASRAALGTAAPVHLEPSLQSGQNGPTGFWTNRPPPARTPIHASLTRSPCKVQHAWTSIRYSIATKIRS
jgi:hypothetical protein